MRHFLNSSCWALLGRSFQTENVPELVPIETVSVRPLLPAFLIAVFTNFFAPPRRYFRWDIHLINFDTRAEHKSTWFNQQISIRTNTSITGPNWLPENKPIDTFRNGIDSSFAKSVLRNRIWTQRSTEPESLREAGFSLRLKQPRLFLLLISPVLVNKDPPRDVQTWKRWHQNSTTVYHILKSC